MPADRREEHWLPVNFDGADPAIDEHAIDAVSRWTDPRVVTVSPGHDLFQSDVPRPVIDRVFEAMTAAPQHEYLLLTVCAKRLLALGNDGLVMPRSLWLGVTVEEDEQIWRVEDLLRCNTARAWVSVRPRGPVPSLPVEMLSWLVCTAEKGVDLGLARSLRDRCTAAGIPFRYLTVSPEGMEGLAELDGRVWDGVPWAGSGLV